MDSYGHYAVDNGLEPVAGMDMPAGTVVTIGGGPDGGETPLVWPFDQSGPVVGVLAYAVTEGCTCTIATDGVVAVRIVGEVAVGQWVYSGQFGQASPVGSSASVAPEDCILGRALVACEERASGGDDIETLAAVHLNILPPGVGFPADDNGGD